MSGEKINQTYYEDVEGREAKEVPSGWKPMPDEYALTDEDRESGLEELLYDSRDTAADFLSDFAKRLNLDTDRLEEISRIPIGLEDGSVVSGKCLPGFYGIILGRDSEEIIEAEDGYLWGDEKARGRAQRMISRSILHEMIHTLQVTEVDGKMVTIGDAIENWSGLEEGMTEALANTIAAMQKKHLGIQEAAADLENWIEQRQVMDPDDIFMPATQACARMVKLMSPELLRWYLACAQTGSYREENKLQDVFGEDYSTLLGNLNGLYGYEIYGAEATDSERGECQELLLQTEQIIDKHLKQKKPWPRIRPGQRMDEAA